MKRTAKLWDQGKGNIRVVIRVWVRVWIRVRVWFRIKVEGNFSPQPKASCWVGVSSSPIPCVFGERVPGRFQADGND